MGISLLSSSVSAAVTVLCILASVSPIQCDATIHPESRIIFGETAEDGEFPHQVLARIPKIKGGKTVTTRCGGSILNADYILTAAHCVNNAIASTRISFIAGKHDLTNSTESDRYDAEEVIIHPCFNQEENIERDVFKNDIALVKLAKPLPLNDGNIQAIQIDHKNWAVEETDTVVIGWGWLSANRTFPAKLKKASFQVTASKCKHIRAFLKMDPAGQICASNDKAFACNGDSGGPLLCDDDETNVVCGIVSLVSNLPREPRCHGPGVYTRVYHYREWVQSVLAGRRNSAAGCIGGRYVPKTTPKPEATPKPEPTPKPGTTRKPTPEPTRMPEPKPKPKPETTHEPETTPESTTEYYYEYDDSSRGFPSYRPSRFVCGFCLILTFLSLWGRNFF